MTFDPATIAAFVDGELDDLTARRIEREAETDAALATEIARHRALKAQLTAHFAPVLDEDVPDRLRALLVHDDAVDTSLAARREMRRARFGAVHWGAMAASLALGLTVGLRPWVPTPDVRSDAGVLVASGPLADALDTQLASNQAPGAPVRIGVSFRDRTGRYCRSFESTGTDGIGCREAGRWELEQLQRGRPADDYRQAASGAIASAAAGMMAGEPLDAAAERRARDADWNE